MSDPFKEMQLDMLMARHDFHLIITMEFKLPWREAGLPNHHDDKVDSDQ